MADPLRLHTLARQSNLLLYVKGLRADFLLRIAANENNGRRAAYLQVPLRYFGFPVYRRRSLKSARKHLTQSIGY